MYFSYNYAYRKCGAHVCAILKITIVRLLRLCLGLGCRVLSTFRSSTSGVPHKMFQDHYKNDLVQSSSQAATTALETEPMSTQK